jgi:hypothetical protein
MLAHSVKDSCVQGKMHRTDVANLYRCSFRQDGKDKAITFNEWNPYFSVITDLMPIIIVAFGLK